MAASAQVARFIGILALLLLPSACGDERDAAPGPAAPPDAALVPVGLPADVPLPQDARIVRETSTGDGGIQLALESDVPAEALLRDYRDALVKMGWTLGEDAPRAGSGSLAASKGTRSLSLGVEDRAPGSRLVLRTGRAAP